MPCLFKQIPFCFIIPYFIFHKHIDAPPCGLHPGNLWARSEVKVSQLCLTLCDPMDYTVHGILQARILEWVAVPFSRGPSQGSNPVLPHYRQILYHLRDQGSPMHQVSVTHWSWVLVVVGLIFRRRRWHPTPVRLPGKSHGRRSLVGCNPWGR